MQVVEFKQEPTRLSIKEIYEKGQLYDEAPFPNPRIVSYMIMLAILIYIYALNIYTPRDSLPYPLWK